MTSLRRFATPQNQPLTMRNSLPRIYLYKLTSDTGGAPCVQNGLLSLAICKPIICGRAMRNDLIFGFAAKSLSHDNRLIYVARVTEKLCDGNYYKDNRYARRDDCIYKRKAGRFKWKKGSLHHGKKHITRDLGSYPKYVRANVLLSADFRYFGKAGSDRYKAEFPKVRSAIERLARGHRVRLSEPLRKELFEMKHWVWRGTRKRVSGRPTSAPSPRVCLSGGSCAVT